MYNLETIYICICHIKGRSNKENYICFNCSLILGELLVNSNLTDLTKVYGSVVTFWCSVTYEIKYGNVRVIWNKRRNGNVTVVSPAYDGHEKVALTKNSHPIQGKDGFIIDNHYLTIKSLSFNDSARYWCFSVNNFSTESLPSKTLTIIGGK